MPSLPLPPDFPFPAMVATVAEGDTMHDGRDGHYLAVGLSALACIRAALGGRQPCRILDLPCGFGRVTRVLRAQYPNAAITVCDLDRPGVDFAAAQFDARPVYSAEDFATLDFNERYDLIWVGSLITHFSQAQTSDFLGCMARHMAPGGVLVASSHGPTVAAGLVDWGYGLDPRAVAGLLDDYRTGGYGHRGYGGSAGYGISLTDRLWWQTMTATGPLQLAGYRAQAWDGHQDIVVLRKGGLFGRAAAWMQSRAGRQAAQQDAAVRLAAAQYDDCMATFDTEYYLAANPDVTQALLDGLHVTAFQHYWKRGRVEGRRPHGGRLPVRPVPPASSFDEAWYLLTFPDVAAAVARNEIASGYDHWVDEGRGEGRPRCRAEAA